MMIGILIGAAAISSGAQFGARTVAVPPGGKAGFTQLLPADTGVAFTNLLFDASAEKNRILENGSGVALGDVDGDGRCDIYICGLERPNALFRNLGGWKFAEVANAGGAACAGQPSTGAAFADIDGDGDLDLVVNGLAAGTRLFRNDGHGVFAEDLNAGLDRQCAATSLALADIDGDGDLDLYVTAYRRNTIHDGPPPGFQVFQQGGRLMAKPEDQYEFRDSPTGPQLIEKPEPDFLYINDGTGKFSAASWTDGRFLDEEGKALAAPPRHWGLAAMFRDLNGDRAPDLYVCNDFLDSPDQLWMNDGRGSFRLISRLAVRHTSWSSMAVDFADINRDGHDDFFVADMLSPDNIRRQTQRANAELASIRILPGEIENRPQNFQNTLQLNRGDGTFAEISNLAGLAATDWTWSAIFLDVDLDGWEDLLVTTGNNHDIQDADVATLLAPNLSLPPHLRPKTLLRYPPLHTPRRAYRNNRDLTFAERGHDWGFDQVGISQGMALGDLDGDGDLDLVVNNLQTAAALYRNNSSAPRIAVRLKGRPGNTAGIGARIQVLADGRPQTQEMIAGGRYLSGDEPLRTFAAPAPAQSVRVRWRSGGVSEIPGLAPNQVVEIKEPEPPHAPADPQGAGPSPWFEDVSERLSHAHAEPPFDDFGLQALLPNRLSQLGPQALFLDLDGDGWEDLAIGAGRGGSLALFRNDGRGGFAPAPHPFPLATGDHDGLAAIRLGGRTSLAVALSNLESGGLDNPSVLVGGFSGAVEAIPGQGPSAGPLAAADIDGDGKPELFVGSRFMPGRYPQAGPSRIFRFDGSRWRIDRALSASVAEAGLVNAALWVDLDGDGGMELVLACDWGSPKVYRSSEGRLIEVSAHLGLAHFTGRWNCVAAADFDGDGRPDLVFGNWGRNTRSQRFMARPLQLALIPRDGHQKPSVLESFFDPTLQKHVPWRGRISIVRHFPETASRFPSFAAFGAAGTEELLAGIPHETLEASTLDTMLFLNRTNHFVPAPLPVEAQFSPAMGAVAADFNGDGKQDLFLAQNLFALHSESTRLDAGRGLLLEGDGRGAFRAVPGPESGLLIYGEQRGCAAADFNHDGAPDLVVTQNNGPTRLFLNKTARR